MAMSLKIKIQLYCGEEIAMGPGKADLLDAIMAHGSISAAGRALGMSYRRCWQLVDVMNRCWQEPLVKTAIGRVKGGGAQVTPFGAAILAHYRGLQDRLGEAAGGADSAGLAAAILPQPRASQKAYQKA